MQHRRASRRSFLTGAAVLALGPRFTGIRPALAQDAGPTPGPYPALAITVRDDGFDLPAELPAGRYHVTVTNAGAGGSHLSLGRIPEAITDDQVALWLDDDPTNNGTTEEFSTIQFVGLPDWPVPGATISGVIELEAGGYLAIDPISEKRPSVLQVTGQAATAPDPPAGITVTLQEMTIERSSTAVPTGRQLWRVVNNGAFTHETAILPVGDGTTDDDLSAYMQWVMSQQENGTPSSAPPTADKIDLLTYMPAAAMSLLHPGGTSWVEFDLPEAPTRRSAWCRVRPTTSPRTPPWACTRSSPWRSMRGHGAPANRRPAGPRWEVTPMASTSIRATPALRLPATWAERIQIAIWVVLLTACLAVFAKTARTNYRDNVDLTFLAREDADRLRAGFIELGIPVERFARYTTGLAILSSLAAVGISVLLLRRARGDWFVAALSCIILARAQATYPPDIPRLLDHNPTWTSSPGC